MKLAITLDENWSKLLRTLYVRHEPYLRFFQAYGLKYKQVGKDKL